MDSTELATNSNGIIDKYGDYSQLHRYGYSYAKAYEGGVTLALANAATEIKVDLLPSVKTDCIEDIVIYDIWKSDDTNGEYNNQAMDSISYGCDMITLAYTINTVTFEKDYGFSFPVPTGMEAEEMSDTITMLVEYSCLSECYFPTISYQVGDSIRDLVIDGNFSIGLCHDGINRASDTVKNAQWYFHFENVPHVTIKIAFLNYSNVDLYDTNTSTYAGITGSNYTDFWYQANPMLWFKGFRTEVDDEALAGLVAA